MSERARADSIVRDLARKGYTATISPAVIGGKTLYRVRVVGLANEESARQAMGRLRADGYPEARLAAE
jgi:cell division septation protein DedD